MWKDPDTAKYIIAIALAFFGAVVHATNQLRIARKYGDSFGFIDVAILLPTCIFSGLLFGLLAQLMSDNPIHLMLSVSTGAFLGIAGLNKVADAVLSMIIRGRSNDDGQR
jgi:hypothetical protein